MTEKGRIPGQAVSGAASAPVCLRGSDNCLGSALAAHLKKSHLLILRVCTPEPFLSRASLMG